MIKEQFDFFDKYIKDNGINIDDEIEICLYMYLINRHPDIIDNIDNIKFIIDYEDNINKKIKLLKEKYTELVIDRIPSDKDKFILCILAFKDDRSNNLFDFLSNNNYSLLNRIEESIFKIKLNYINDNFLEKSNSTILKEELYQEEQKKLEEQKKQKEIDKIINDELEKLGGYIKIKKIIKKYH
jgi:hypothetical protein